MPSAWGWPMTRHPKLGAEERRTALLTALRGNEWVAGIGDGPNVVKVSVADVRIEHEVKLLISRSGWKGSDVRHAR
jgi:hypothetical protein